MRKLIMKMSVSVDGFVGGPDGKNDWIFKSSLLATGLIDEYLLATHPVILGSGLPIFTGLTKPLDLTLADVKVFPKGGIIARVYHPA